MPRRRRVEKLRRTVDAGTVSRAARNGSAGWVAFWGAPDAARAAFDEAQQRLSKLGQLLADVWGVDYGTFLANLDARARLGAPPAVEPEPDDDEDPEPWRRPAA
jgi:hypothetical protein